MKKLFLVLVAICLSTFSYANNANDESESFMVEISITEVSSGSSMMEIIVKANSVVDEMCNYFDDSYVDKALSLYCKFNKTSAVCTAYNITKGVCAINGAIKLYIEGDISSAILRAVDGASKLYSVSKLSRSEYEIREVGNLNSCSVTW